MIPSWTFDIIASEGAPLSFECQSRRVLELTHGVVENDKPAQR